MDRDLRALPDRTDDRPPKAGPDPFAAGRLRLRQPLMPLARLVVLTFLVSRHPSVAELLEQLPQEMVVGGRVYRAPAALLAPHLDLLAAAEAMRRGEPDDRLVVSEDLTPVKPLIAFMAGLTQGICSRELETINSLLCDPCGCSVCCTGPRGEMHQLFFEIPLEAAEPQLFPVPVVDSPASRSCTSSGEPPLLREGKPFYETPTAVYRWQNGWSLILPRQADCPHLAPDVSRCRIYVQRPQVCRRPQLFPYALERCPAGDRPEDGRVRQGFMARHKLLAVWDCPYVRQLVDEIADYAAASMLSLVLARNKA
ncbi:MAG: hypothetical protein AB1634_15265 [Thermodesulfobacteriota bacterium]